MDNPETFCKTVGGIARLADVCDDSLRTYSDLGLIECMRLEDGTRLFKPSAASQARELKKERLARRGGDHRKKTTA